MQENRFKLEKINFTNPEGKLMLYIKDLNAINDKYDEWTLEIENLKSGQQLLDKPKNKYYY